MKKFLKTYKSVIILLAAIIIGAIVGIAFKEKAAVLKALRGYLPKFTICSNSSAYIPKYHNINCKN